MLYSTKRADWSTWLKTRASKLLTADLFVSFVLYRHSKLREEALRAVSNPFCETRETIDSIYIEQDAGEASVASHTLLRSAQGSMIHALTKTTDPVVKRAQSLISRSTSQFTSAEGSSS